MGDDYQLINYEKLVLGYPTTITDILDWIGVEQFNPSVQAQFLSHSVSGNPCRFDSKVDRIQLDEEWESKLSAFDRCLVSVLCGRMQRRYGYV